MKRWAPWVTAFALLLGGCKSPFERTKDADGSGALGPGTIGGSGRLVVYSNELQTGGGAFLYPSGENQALSFNDQSNPVSARSIRYTWNGQDVAGQNVFAGVDLMHTPTQATYSATTGRDLSAAGYTQVTFYARGALGTHVVVKVEVADEGNTGTAAPCMVLSANGTDGDPASPGCTGRGQLTPSWTQQRVTGVTPTHLSNIKDFFKATFVYTVSSTIDSSGGTLYLDQIQYEP
jgi:hypothetical protein